MLLPTCPCCGTNPCPECRHFTATICYGIEDTGQINVTINGNALPYTVSVPASVVTPCCDIGATVSATFSPGSTNPAVRTLAANISGCTQCYAYFQVRINICGWTFFAVFSRLAGDCNDTGGAFVPGSPGHAAGWFTNDDVRFNEDCMIAVREWLGTFTIAGTITYDPCECPP